MLVLVLPLFLLAVLCFYFEKKLRFPMVKSSSSDYITRGIQFVDMNICHIVTS